MSLVEWKWFSVPGKSGWKTQLREDWRHEHGTALTEFWNRVRTGESRLLLLKEFADRTVARLQPYSAIRRGGGKRRRGGGACWACRESRKLQEHHIIQVQHGGRNVKRNKVFICFPCHAEVHPWMKGKRTARTKQPDAPQAQWSPADFDPRPRLRRNRGRVSWGVLDDD